MRAVLAVLLFTALASPVAARDAALAREFLRVSGAPTSHAQVAEALRARLDAAVEDETCESLQPILRERNDKAARRLDALVKSPKAEGAIVAAVQATYTDAELTELIALFKTKAGQLYASRQGKLTRALGEASEAFVQLAMEDAESLFTQYESELEQASEQCPRGEDEVEDYERFDAPDDDDRRRR